MSNVIKGTVATTGKISGALHTSSPSALDALIKSALKKINKVTTITLFADKWEGETSPYSQVITVSGATENSKVDLNPTVEQLGIFHNKDIAFVVENDDGVITVYCVGQKPTNDYTMQATITEVYVNG